MPILFLVAYHFLFWNEFYRNPYLLCTSEIASTFFPHWVWMGRQLRQGIFPAQDEIYYKYPASIPFLSTFYPPNLLAAWVGSFLDRDRAFRLYAYVILAHYLLASIMAYYCFGSLFGAITLTYAGYMIKPMTPCFVYSMAWVLLSLKGGVIGGVAWGMSLMGGYYPILVYFAPVLAVVQPLAFIAGIGYATPQIISFIGYFKRSIRDGQEVDQKTGRIPWYRLFDLVNPIRNLRETNGVHYPEMMMYMGIAPFLIFYAFWWWIPLLTGLLICVGILPSVQRIPARACFLITLSVASLTSYRFQEAQAFVPFLILQSFSLLRNSNIYPSFPFSQWWNRPSRIYKQTPKAYNWPFNTGYLQGERVSDYRGAFRLKSE